MKRPTDQSAQEGIRLHALYGRAAMRADVTETILTRYLHKY